MLTLHRRHISACLDAVKGWNYTLCDCPIWCDGTLNGARYKRSLQTTDKALALRRIQRLESGNEVDVIAPAATRTVAAAVRDYLADAERRKVQPSTLKSYRFTLGLLVKVFAGRPVDALTDDRLRQYQQGRKVKPRTERKEVEHLRAFFAFCISRGWLKDNPAKAIKPPMAEELGTLPFTSEEVQRLLTACDGARSRALILTLLYSGLRVSDVTQLKRSALAPDGHLTLRIMKTGAPLKVLLHPDACQALGKLPCYRNPTFYFWSGSGGIRAASGSLRRTVDRIGARADIHATPHRFRDTFAVELLSNGADIRTVQMLLGHESVKTTERHYAHFVAAHQKLLDSAAATLDFRPKAARPVLVHARKNRLRNAK